MKPHSLRRCFALLLGALALADVRIQAQGTSGPAMSGPGATRKGDEAIKLDAFRVTGTNINRLESEKVLPVTVLNRDLIEARNALTPVELLTALPQVTTVPLNESSSGSVNARGDNASLNIRGIGAGSTLVLLNGRRVAPHPMTSPEAGQLSFFVNVNQLPMHGLERIEFLRDGASSIYGSDAIAGVINFVTRRDFHGTEVHTRIALPEHGAGQSVRAAVMHGQRFGAGKGRWLTTLDYVRRRPISYAERSRTRTADHSALAPPPFNMPGSVFDDRAIGVYPSFRVGAGSATHWLRPVNGTPALTGVPPNRVTDPEFYFDFTRFQNVGQARTERVNWFNHVEVDLTERITAFTDVSFYHARTRLLRQPTNFNAPTSDDPATVSSDNPFNPYGSRFYHPAGAPNPDGSPRLTGAPQAVTLLTLALLENGAEEVDVNSGVFRAVAGLRGRLFDQWWWETGALHTRAYASDISNNAVRESLFQQVLQRTDATAFNPFGYTFRVLGNAVVADQPYTNPKSVLGSFLRPWRRDGYSAITSFDARAAGPAIDWGSQTVSVAAGAEFRREQFADHRSPFAGINPPESGLNPDDNDFILASPKRDSSGDRDVYGAYVETIFPVSSPARDLPGVYSLELTASARHEEYSDFGATTRPKFGVNWRPAHGLMIRASYNRGFAAPNLPTLHAPSQYTVDGLPGRVDPYRNQTVGSGQYVMRNYTSGNKGLRPITSTGKSAGVVLEVSRLRGLSVTADYWEIDQQDVVGARTDTQILNSDHALLRAYTAAQLAAGRTMSQIDLGSGTAGYKGDPGVVRNMPTAQDIAAFNAFNAGRPPAEQAAVVGTIFSRYSPFENIARAFARGVDFSLAYVPPALSWGRLSFSTDWSYLIESYQTRHGAGARPTKSERLEVDGVTRWRGMGTLIWQRNKWTVSLAGYYIGDYADSVGATTETAFERLGQPRYISRQFTDGNFAHRYRVRDVLSGNAAVGYDFGRDASWLFRGTSIRLGVINFTDREPPLTPDTAGYAPAIHSSLFPGRTWTLELTRRF